MTPSLHKPPRYVELIPLRDSLDKSLDPDDIARVIARCAERLQFMTKKSRTGEDHPLLPMLHEQARPRRGSAAKHVHYQWKPGGDLPDIGAHSIAKHDIYDEYVVECIMTLTKNHAQQRLQLTIVDGFCGGGLYRFGGGIVDGSPLRLLRAVDKARAALAAQGRNGFRLEVEFLFIDDKVDHVEFLREELHRRELGSEIGRSIHLINSRFETVADDVVERIRGKGTAHHSLFFLDQFGWNTVSLDVIRRIMHRLKTPEVVLTFMVDALANLLDSRKSSVSALAKIDFSREDARALVAMKDMEGWKTLIQNFLYSHIQANTGAEFYTPFFVHPPDSHRDYWLLHLSKHHQAREEIGKVFWRKNNTMEHFGRAGFHALGFDPAQDMRQHVMAYTFDDDGRARSQRRVLEQLPAMLHGEWTTGAPVTKRSIFASRANDTPIVGDIVDSQLCELRAAGEVVIHKVRRDATGKVVGRSIRERTRTFGWDDEIVRPRQPTLFSFGSQAAG